MDWYLGTNTIVSMGVISDGSYGVDEELCFSFPVKCNNDFTYEIIKGLEFETEFAKEKFNKTLAELKEEKSEIVFK